MKLLRSSFVISFSTLFLGLAAHANLPTKIPTNIQEKLAWGLCALDKKVIAAALKAGANPFTCHKTEIGRQYISQALQGENILEGILAAEEISPYLGIITAAYLAAVAGNDKILPQLLEVVEVFFKHGVSVDRKYTFLYNEPVSTFREFLEKMRDKIEASRHVENFPPEAIAFADFTNKFLGLINKYQPKVK